MIVKERLIVFGPSDIKKARIVCAECDGEVVYPLHSKDFHARNQCTHCGARWPKGSHEQILRLVASVKYLGDENNSPLIVSFEMNDTESK